MRPTLRANGRQMSTFHLSHSLGGAEIAEVLAGYASLYSAERIPLTRSAGERLIREQLTQLGTGAYWMVGGWTDGKELDGTEIAEIGAWVVAVVRHCWPEMSDQALSDWEFEYTGQRADR